MLDCEDMRTSCKTTCIYEYVRVCTYRLSRQAGKTECEEHIVALMETWKESFTVGLHANLGCSRLMPAYTRMFIDAGNTVFDRVPF